MGVGVAEAVGVGVIVGVVTTTRARGVGVGLGVRWAKMASDELRPETIRVRRKGLIDFIEQILTERPT
jgi:hypothetical protein